MARRRRYDDEDEEYLAPRTDPRMAMAMELLQSQLAQEKTTEDRDLRERQMAAEEMWRRGQLEQGAAQERRLLGMAEETKRREETAETTRQRERTEDLGREREKEKLAQSEKEKDRAAREKEHQIDVVKELYPEGEERKRRLATLDPEYAKISKGLKAEKLATDVEANLERFKKASPKQRTLFKANPSEVGGKEALAELERRVMGEEAAAVAPRPDLTPTVGTPPVSAVGQGGVWQHEIPRMTVPAIGGITEPVTIPQAAPAEAESVDDFVKRVLSTPDYVGGGVPLPTSEEIRAGIESDPRYKPAEQELLEGAMNWWNKANAVPVQPAYDYGGTNRSVAEEVAPPEFAYEEGYPSAMPGKIEGPGLLDLMLAKIAEARNAPARKWGHGAWTPPIGSGLLPPRPTQLLGEQEPGGLFR